MSDQRPEAPAPEVEAPAPEVEAPAPAPAEIMPDASVDAVKAELAAARKDAAKYRAKLRELEKAPAPDVESMREELTQLQETLKAERVAAAKADIARRFDLGDSQLAFITGETAEEMALQAEALITAFGVRTTAPVAPGVRPALSGGSAPTEAPSLDPEQLADKIRKRASF